jgi:hypothetical protein
MKSALFTTGALALAAAFTSAIVAAPQQSTPQQVARPGEMTRAEVWIQNRAPAEAIPVRLEMNDADRPLRVQLPGTVAVSVQPGTPVATRRASQSWAYDSITARDAQAAKTALNAMGQQGWETTGVQFTSPEGTVILLKRPQ